MRFFSGENEKFRYIKYLKLSFIILFVTVLISQIGLFTDMTRNFFTAVDILDGADPASGNGIAEPGEIILKLDKGKPCDKITILINGDEYSKFVDSTIKIPINNQSVVEVVNDTNKIIEVSCSYISDNLTYTYRADDTSIDKISVICRVVFKS